MTQSTSPTAGRATFSDRLPSLADIGPLAALVIACAFFIWQSNRFLSIQNLSLILQQTMVVAVIAIGQTLIVLTGGIDLSCGMLMAFGSIVMTKFAVTLGVPPVLAIICGVAASTLFG
ncbi:MAG TPA: ABC transporter permease, partial [Caballeronia sp.]|nr:ABC transporter permease [Caballeronia sp.]